ncbi:MAG: hypothetical protein DRQ88_13290, partial [Epsilonproteobacteria bacterium]
MSCYKIKNTTKKKGALKGKHKLGFVVSIPKGPWLKPGATAIIENVTDPILNFSKRGWLSLEKSEDSLQDLKMEAVEAEMANPASEPMSADKKKPTRKRPARKTKENPDPLAELEQPV